MKNLQLKTNNNWESLIIRLTLGVILLPHGAQKVFGIFGGYGFTGTMDYLTQTLHIPWLISLLIIIIEFVGPLAIISGFASRLWASLTIVLMIGIIISSHLDNGFFMNWFGNQKGEGFEYHLLVIGMALSIVISGSGKFSIDNLISQ